jgi:hypothetical protein
MALCAQFFIPIADMRIENEGELIRDHKIIAKRYLKGWFLLDVLSVLPFDLLTIAAPGAVADGPMAKSFKLVRIMRLVKLARVLRASRIIQRWENRISVSYSTRSLLTAVTGIIVLLHWLTCLWAMLPQLMSNWRESDAAAGLEPAVAACMADASSCVWPGWGTPSAEQAVTSMQCTGCVQANASTAEICDSTCLTPCERRVLGLLINEGERFILAQEHWVCRAIDQGFMTRHYEDKPFTLWVTSGSAAMLTLVGGVAGIVPSNQTEYYVFISAVILGTMAFAAVQGIIVQVMTQGDPMEVHFKQQMDALNFMMIDQKVPVANRWIVRDYYRRSKKMLKRKSYCGLIDACLSRELSGDVRYLISHEVFASVWWLNKCERSFLEDLSVFIEREAFAAKEKIPSDSQVLNILMQGVATRGGAIIAVGSHWGDIIITSPMLRDTREAKALGYCEVSKLTRDALYATSAHYPQSARIIHEAALKVATARSMMIISMYAKLHAAQEARQKAKARELAIAARASAFAQPSSVGGWAYAHANGPMGPAGGFYVPPIGVPPWAIDAYMRQQVPPPLPWSPQYAELVGAVGTNSRSGTPPPGSDTGSPTSQTSDRRKGGRSGTRTKLKGSSRSPIKKKDVARAHDGPIEIAGAPTGDGPLSSALSPPHPGLSHPLSAAHLTPAGLVNGGPPGFPPGFGEWGAAPPPGWNGSPGSALPPWARNGFAVGGPPSLSTLANGELSAAPAAAKAPQRTPLPVEMLRRLRAAVERDPSGDASSGGGGSDGSSGRGSDRGSGRGSEAARHEAGDDGAGESGLASSASVGSGGGLGASALGLGASALAQLESRLDGKLEQLLRQQEVTQSQVESIDARLARLDSLADAVASINSTLKRAAQMNRQSGEGDDAGTYVRTRPLVRLPGQGGPPPTSTPTRGSTGSPPQRASQRPAQHGGGGDEHLELQA